MRRWYEDRIPVTWGSVWEATWMSIVGVWAAFAILACICWFADNGWLDVLK